MTVATVGAVADVLRGHRFAYRDEYDLQDGIESVLADAGIEHMREVDIGAGRIDFLAGRVGVEVKVAGQLAAVARQCERYLASGMLDGLVLVTNRPRHCGLGRELVRRDAIEVADLVQVVVVCAPF